MAIRRVLFRCRRNRLRHPAAEGCPAHGRPLEVDSAGLVGHA